MKVKEKLNYICKTCKYNYTKDCFVYEHNGHWLNDYATCGGWTDPEEVDLEAQATDAAERKTHRKEVEGREIE